MLITASNRCYYEHMLRRYILSFVTTLAILIGLMMVLVGLLFATGELRTWGGAGKLGLLSPDVRGLPSYYNPAIETGWLVETVALFFLPIVLFTLRKHLMLPTIPWAIVGLVAIGAYFIWPARLDEIDTSLVSLLPYFLRAQLPLAGGCITGYVLLAVKATLQNHSTVHAPNP